MVVLRRKGIVFNRRILSSANLAAIDSGVRCYVARLKQFVEQGVIAFDEVIVVLVIRHGRLSSEGRRTLYHMRDHYLWND
jgi:hypothetical protein